MKYMASQVHFGIQAAYLQPLVCYMPDFMQSIRSLLLMFQDNWGSKHLRMSVNQYLNNTGQGTLCKCLGNDHYRVKQDKSLKNILELDWQRGI